MELSFWIGIWDLLNMYYDNQYFMTIMFNKILKIREKI